MSGNSRRGSANAKMALYEYIIAQLSGSLKRGRHAQVTNIISDMIVDRATSYGDSYMSISGVDLFMFFCNMSRAPIPVNNAWRLDLVMIFVPNRFVNVDQIRVVAKSYNPNSQSVSIEKGVLLAKFDRESISKTFMLNSNTQVRVPIDFLCLGRAYDRDKGSFKVKWLPFHRRTKGDGKPIAFFKTNVEPFYYENFEDYFIYTHFALCQVLGIDVKYKMPMNLMMLATEI